MKLESLETLLDLLQGVSFQLFDFEEDPLGRISLERHTRIRAALEDLQREIDEMVAGKHV